VARDVPLLCQVLRQDVVPSLRVRPVGRVDRDLARGHLPGVLEDSRKLARVEPHAMLRADVDHDGGLLREANPLHHHRAVRAPHFIEERLAWELARARRRHERRRGVRLGCTRGAVQALAFHELAERLRAREATEATRTLLDVDAGVSEVCASEASVAARTRYLVFLGDRPGGTTLAADARLARREHLGAAPSARDARSLREAFSTRAIVPAAFATAIETVKMDESGSGQHRSMVRALWPLRDPQHELRRPFTLAPHPCQKDTRPIMRSHSIPISALATAITAAIALVACREEPPAAAPAPTTAAASTESPAAGANATIAVGTAPPDFAAVASDGTRIQLSALKGKPVVVYFYPKDETPGCTAEACSFRDSWSALSAKGVVLIGVSADSDESHRGFAQSHKLPFLLVSDANGAIARQFGVPVNAGIISRQSFVIGADGKVKKIYRTVDVTAHAAQIAADVQ